MTDIDGMEDFIVYGDTNIKSGIPLIDVDNGCSNGNRQVPCDFGVTSDESRGRCLQEKSLPAADVGGNKLLVRGCSLRSSKKTLESSQKIPDMNQNSIVKDHVQAGKIMGYPDLSHLSSQPRSKSCLSSRKADHDALQKAEEGLALLSHFDKRNSWINDYHIPIRKPVRPKTCLANQKPAVMMVQDSSHPSGSVSSVRVNRLSRRSKTSVSTRTLRKTTPIDYRRVLNPHKGQSEDSKRESLKRKADKASNKKSSDPALQEQAVASKKDDEIVKKIHTSTRKRKVPVEECSSPNLDREKRARNVVTTGTVAGSIDNANHPPKSVKPVRSQVFVSSRNLRQTSSVDYKRVANPKARTGPIKSVPRKSSKKQAKEEDREYEVEKVVGIDTLDDETIYCVKWLGFVKTTWEPSANLSNARMAVMEFHKIHKIPIPQLFGSQ